MDLHTEEAWHSPADPFAFPPLPQMEWSSRTGEAIITGTNIRVTDEHYRACGYRKMRRQVTDWEEVED